MLVGTEVNLVKATRCKAKDPSLCTNHGGRIIDGVSKPLPWRNRQDGNNYSQASLLILEATSPQEKPKIVSSKTKSSLTRCRAKDPKICKNHGGRTINGRAVPLAWRGMSEHKSHEDIKATRCRAKNPNQCKEHGGRIVAGVRSPRPWKGMTKTITAQTGRTVWHTRQIHGFRNEFRICQKYNLQKMDKYTSEWDAYTKTVNPIPVSIKTKAIGGDIELGDFFRNAKKNEDFYLHVSFWAGKKDRIVSEHILLIPGDEWNNYFTDEYHDDIRLMLSNSSPDISYDEKWKTDVESIKEKWSNYKSPIRLRPKRDHKGQIRMQCAINYGDFMKMSKKYSVDTLALSL